MADRLAAVERFVGHRSGYSAAGPAVGRRRAGPMCFAVAMRTLWELGGLPAAASGGMAGTIGDTDGS